MNLPGKWLGATRVRIRLRRCASVGPEVRVLGRVWIHGGGKVRIGRGVVLDASRAPIELHAERDAEIVIGDAVRIEGGVSIEAVRSVVVGRGAVLRAWCKVLDNHFHSPSNRNARPPSEPVLIGDGAVVGEKAVVLPGAQLGPGAWLDPGVVIGRRVPARAVLAGSPPRMVKREPS